MKNRQMSGNEVPIAPADPVYEEVDIAMIPRTQDIQLECNEAYGRVRKYNDRDLCIIIDYPTSDGKALLSCS